MFGIHIYGNPQLEQLPTVVEILQPEMLNKIVRYLLWHTTLLFLGFGIAFADGQPSINFDEIVFLSIRTQSGKIQLINGEYREPSTPCSVAQTVVNLTQAKAYGRLDGREVSVVILVTDLGGSGTFYDLALLVKGPQGWVNEAIAFLGDRINIHSLVIADNAVEVDMTTHGPEDAMCCPTRRVIQRFVLHKNQLIKAGEKVRVDVKPDLINVTWRWQQTVYHNDRKNVPLNPANYTLKLLADGKVGIRADCNRGGGVYTLRGNEIAMEIAYTTRAACPPESLGQDFIKDLNAAARYFMEAGILYIDLKLDTGTMKFMK